MGHPTECDRNHVRLVAEALTRTHKGRTLMAHPLLKLRVRAGLRAQGKGFSEINSIMDGWDDELPSIAAGMLPEAESAAAVGALGDGTLIQALIDFLKSPAGQALVQLIIKLLLGGL